MKKKSAIGFVVLLGAPLAFGYAGTALSATLNLTDTLTYNGSSLVASPTGLLNGTIDATNSFNYGNAPLHDQYFAAGPSVPVNTYDFYDDYVFSTSGAVGNTITTTISLAPLAINNLQVRLYRVDGPAPNLGPVIYAPNGGSVDSWSTSISSGPVTATYAITLPAAFYAGTYDLQIRGDVAGSAGGSYSGVLNLVPVPVPLPAALPLLLSGLGLFGGAVRRKNPRGAQQPA